MKWPKHSLNRHDGPMATVAVTTGTSAVGSALLTRLMAAGHRTYAIGGQRPDVAVGFRPANPDGSLHAGALQGIDVVVHALIGHEPSRDSDHDAALDVESTRSLLQAAEVSKPQALIFISSAVVYGAHEDNAVPLTELAPLRAEPDFSYAWLKRVAEELLAQWAIQNPDVRVVVLRPVTVLDAGHDDFVARHFESPRLPLVRGHTPPMQVLHMDDLADAVAVAVSGDLHGAYNVAPDGWLTTEEVFDLLGRKPVDLPESVAFELAQRLWASHLAAAPAGGLHYLMYPWVVDTRRLRDAGWAPQRTNREVLEAFTQLHRGHVTIGPLRTTKRAVATAAAVGAASAATALATRAVKRRHESRG